MEGRLKDNEDGFMVSAKPTVLARARGRKCSYCGFPMLGGLSRPTRDHCHPRAKGGQLTDGNRVIWATLHFTTPHTRGRVDSTPLREGGKL